MDYVIDAIDTLSSKLTLIEMAHRHGVPCISSLGMANRFDPTQLTVTTLDKTCNDPLARALRQMVRKRGFTAKIPVVWSKELPYTQNRLIHAEGKTFKAKISAGQHNLCARRRGSQLCVSGFSSLDRKWIKIHVEENSADCFIRCHLRVKKQGAVTNQEKK